MSNLLKKFDFFPKVSEGVNTRQSAGGGFIFTIFAVLMGVFCFAEVYSLVLGDPVTEPFVGDTDLEDKTRVNLNISLYEVPCEALTLDYQDITGTHFEDMEQTLYKLHLDSAGRIINASEAEIVKKFESKNFHPSVPMWEALTEDEEHTTCYGAELFKGQKCYTCQDVQNAYIQRGWPLPPIESIYQCNFNNKKKRMLMQEQEPIMSKIQKEGIFFSNELFLIDQVLPNHIIPVTVQRSECSSAASTEMALEYMFEADKIATLAMEPVKFAIGECKKSIGLKVANISDDNSEVILESLNFLGSSIKLKSIGKMLFNLTLSNLLGKNEKASFLKLDAPENISGRMLHAEFYGFDDRKPTVIRAEDVAKFEAMLGRGCQIAGTMFLKQVPGNFHISTHHKGLPLQYSAREVTAKHKIHFLEFTREADAVTEGKLGSKIKTNYLSESDDVISPSVGHDVEYYLKIVGSQLNHPIWGEKNFFEYVSHLNIVPKEKNLIRIEFKYEFDPISMRYTDGRKSLTNFIVSLLAIIGGLFATSTLIDRILTK